MNMQASGASELRKIFLQFPSIFVGVSDTLPVSERYIFSGLQLHLHTYTINAVSCHYLWYGTII